MTDEAMRAAFEAKYPNHANIHMLNHHDQMWMNWQWAWQAATAQATTKLTAAVKKVHAAKGRHHNQIAMCDLYDIVGLHCVRPIKTSDTDPAEVAR